MKNKQINKIIIASVSIFIASIIIDTTEFGQHKHNIWQQTNLFTVGIVIVVLTIGGAFLSLFLLREKNYKERIRIIIPIVVIIVSLTSITHTAIQYYGLNEEYNYFVAKRDIKKGKIQLLTVGTPLPSPNFNYEILQFVEKKFGYSTVYIGCTPRHGIDIYNNVVNNYLTQINGQDWQIKEKHFVDSLMQIRVTK